MLCRTNEISGSLFSYVDLKERIPPRSPLRKFRQVVQDSLASINAEFAVLHTDFDRPSIPPERLIPASMPQKLTRSSSKELMEQKALIFTQN